MERRDKRARGLAATPAAVAEPNGPELLERAHGVLERERFDAGLRQVVADLLLEGRLHPLHREVWEPHGATDPGVAAVTRRSATSCGSTVASKPALKVRRSSRFQRSRTATCAPSPQP